MKNKLALRVELREVLRKVVQKLKSVMYFNRLERRLEL
jgi:hypothetical protein